VSRALSGFNEIQWDLDATPIRSSRTLLFCDRVVNDKWKRSFATQSCEISYAAPLSSDEVNELESHLDAGLTESFRKYQSNPHPIHLIANISLGGMPDELVSDLPSMWERILAPRIGPGLTIPEVLKLLAAEDLIRYKSQNPTRGTLQLTCVDHEIKLNEFVFREFRMLHR
jgi:hypothetical protein